MTDRPIDPTPADIPADDEAADDVRDAISAALRREGVEGLERSATLSDQVLEAYEGALVQGLCRDGAREIAADTALAEVRRLIALG